MNKILHTLFTVCLVAVGTVHAQYTQLTDFAGLSTFTGANPLIDQNLVSVGGVLYGMTNKGGPNDVGTIFKINPDGTGYTKLLDFLGSINGGNPRGSLIFDGISLYGMTQNGGTGNLGTIFKINPDGTGYTKLLDFAVEVNGCNPEGSLISDGTSLYGMTRNGGINNMGTIFKINLDGTGYTKLLDFAGATNGRNPLGSLISDGTSLYGMTSSGGTNSSGTIFKINLDGTGYTKLLDFNGTNGHFPYGSLISDGISLYGMTRLGGTNNLGTLFKINPDGTGYTKLIDFAGVTNGSYPWGSLFSDGTSLYGMTRDGGTNNLGTAFKIMPDGTGYLKLLDFAGTTNGSNPYGSLISDGTSLYGMTFSGGINNQGTLFKILNDGTEYSKLLDFDFNTKGSQPFGSLISDGTFLYGMTQYGGINNIGVIFKILPDGTGYSKLMDFDGVNGSRPWGSLISVGGVMYGMTERGGTNSYGTIFKINPDGTSYTKLLDFAGASNGGSPRGSLISDGTSLYGMTVGGGANNLGTIFKINLDGTGYTKLLDFAGATNGSYPFRSLISDGTSLYGMTSQGGTNNLGIVFKINLDGTGYTKLLDFAGATNGSYPRGSLISDGTSLYGMTSGGGANNQGTLFKINPDGTGYVKLLDFAATSNGSNPWGTLISDGTSLYGMTISGGVNYQGTVFKINLDGTGYTKLLDFDGANGSNPYGSLISDGTFLYGMTSQGGSANVGTVFKYNACSSTTGTDIQTACDSYTWIDGNTYMASNNTATFTLTNAAGCDSLVTLDLTINYSNTGTDVQTACDSYTWIDGNTYMASNNTATFTLTNAAGCDSLVTLDLTINYSNTGTDVQTACDSYTWIDGNTYMANNNTATHLLINEAGCDSLVTLDLTINYSNTGTDVQTACDSYTWIDGNTYMASNNTATHLLTNAAGCDSLVTLDLTINYSNTGTDVQTACDSYTWIDGNTYMASNNTATFTLTNAAGCDSLVTLNLTINYSNTGTDIQTACDSYTWIDGNTYMASNNTATFTLTNAAGCDSLVTLDLTINNSTTGTDVQTACDSYTWIDGNTYMASNNTATFTLTNAAGCDSLVTLNLTINNSTTGTDAQTACDSYTWIDGNTYMTSNNTATHLLTNAAGCDSLVTLNLTINNSTTGTDVQTACDSYTWIDGNTYMANNNTATHLLTNAAGCDSLVTLDLTINYSNTGTDVQTACDSYTWIDGNTYMANNNTATHLLTNAAGCDSLVTLDLTINYSNTGTDVQIACDSYTWIDGNTYMASNNTATHLLTNAAGCDSLVTLDLTINTIDVAVVNNSNTLTVNEAGATYQWLDCNNGNQAILGETSQSFTPVSNGSYAVEVTANGCSETSACVEVSTLGLTEVNTKMSVYPNPVNDVLIIEIENSKPIQFEIVNGLGQLVLEGQLTSEKTTLDINYLEPGLYLLRIGENDANFFKIIKE